VISLVTSLGPVYNFVLQAKLISELFPEEIFPTIACFRIPSFYFETLSLSLAVFMWPIKASKDVSRPFL